MSANLRMSATHLISMRVTDVSGTFKQIRESSDQWQPAQSS